MENQKIEVKLLDVWGTDETIANSAWVSTAKQDKDRTEEDVARVVSQMIPRNDTVDHGTPLETVWLRYWVRCPIYVERQFDKYRMTQQYQDFKVEYEFGSIGRDNITQNELSLRYRTMPNDYIEVPKDVIEISNKVNEYLSPEYGEMMLQQMNMYSKIVKDLFNAKNQGNITYDELKRAREFYRGILGTGFFTDMQIVLNANALKNILIQRLSPHAQPEAQEVARLMLKEALNSEKINVMLIRAYEKYDWFIEHAKLN